MSNSRITVPATIFVETIRAVFPQYASESDERVIAIFASENLQCRLIREGANVSLENLFSVLPAESEHQAEATNTDPMAGPTSEPVMAGELIESVKSKDRETGVLSSTISEVREQSNANGSEASMPSFGRQEKTKRPVALWAACIVGIVALCGAGIYYVRNTKVGLQSSKQVEEAKTSAAQPESPPKLVLAAEQNDLTGFDGVPWGTPETKMKFSTINADCDTEALFIAKAIGPPVNWPTEENLELSGEYHGAFKVRFPKGVSFVPIDDSTSYGFYDGKFAFAFKFVGNYDDESAADGALAELKSKNTILTPVGADSWGDSQSLPSYLVDFTDGKEGYLFRRGSTNTRIYIFGHSLVYIPNFFLLAIRDRWQGEYNARAAREVELEQQADEKRRQAVSSAAQ
jgi:hypothetical protein